MEPVVGFLEYPVAVMRVGAGGEHGDVVVGAVVLL